MTKRSVREGWFAFVVFAGALTATVVAPSISLAQSADQTATTSITWETNIPSTSQVLWGMSSGNYTFSTQIDPSLVTAHMVELTGLMPGTLYHYVVVSEDTAGETARSQDQMLMTPAATTTATASTTSGVVNVPSVPVVSTATQGVPTTTTVVASLADWTTIQSEITALAQAVQALGQAVTALQNIVSLSTSGSR